VIDFSTGFNGCSQIQHIASTIKINHLHHNMRYCAGFVACQAEKRDFVNNRCGAASWRER
jgi:hypothetical protein